MASILSNSNEGPVFSFFQLVWLVSLGISLTGQFFSLDFGFIGLLANLVTIGGLFVLIASMVVGIGRIFSK